MQARMFDAEGRKNSRSELYKRKEGRRMEQEQVNSSGHASNAMASFLEWSGEASTRRIEWKKRDSSDDEAVNMFNRRWGESTRTMAERIVLISTNVTNQSASGE